MSCRREDTIYRREDTICRSSKTLPKLEEYLPKIQPQPFVTDLSAKAPEYIPGQKWKKASSS